MSFYEMMVNKTNQRYLEHISTSEIENKNIKLNTDRINNRAEINKAISVVKKNVLEGDIEKFKILKEEAEKNFDKIASLLTKNREIIRDIKDLGTDLNENNIPHALIKFIGFIESKGYRYKDIVRRSRHEELSNVRICIIRQLRSEGYSYSQIGRMFNRDHSTIIHLNKIDMNYYKELANLYSEMLGYLETNKPEIPNYKVSDLEI